MWQMGWRAERHLQVRKHLAVEALGGPVKVEAAVHLGSMAGSSHM